MAVRRSSSYVEADVTLVTTSETVLATLTGVSTSQPGQTVGLTGRYRLTTGAATTTVTSRIRRDSLTGTVVGESTAENVYAAAGSTEGHELYVEESSPGEFAGRTYVLTAQQAGASGNGTAVNAALVAEVSP
jgi:hypothetical protein